MDGEEAWHFTSQLAVTQKTWLSAMPDTGSLSAESEESVVPPIPPMNAPTHHRLLGSYYCQMYLPPACTTSKSAAVCDMDEF